MQRKKGARCNQNIAVDDFDSKNLLVVSGTPCISVRYLRIPHC